MSINIDRQAILEQEMQRIALVLADADFDQYEMAVKAVTQAVESLPEELPEWDGRPIGSGTKGIS